MAAVIAVANFSLVRKLAKRSFLSLVITHSHAWQEKIRTKRDNKNNYVLRSCIIIYENHREKERFVIFIYKNFLIIEASERWLASWEDRSGPAPFILQKSCLSSAVQLQQVTCIYVLCIF